MPLLFVGRRGEKIVQMVQNLSIKIRNSSSQPGYTIVEVMMFLAITGVLLTSALLVFSGRQARTQFSQSVRETESKLRTSINEVASGYYPNSSDFSCSAPAGGGPALSSGTANEQGTNEGCIFLGKVLHFKEGSEVKLYTVVGLQKTSGSDSTEVTTLQEAKPTLIASPSGNTPDNTEDFVIPWGVKVTKIVAEGACGANSISSFGFILGLGGYSGTDLVSGNQSVELLPLCAPTLDANFNLDGVISETESITGANKNKGQVTICLASDSVDEKAAIIIGSENNQLSTSTMIDNQPTECTT